MTRGEAVTIYFEAKGEEDEYGDPVVGWNPVVVDDVLVYELAGSDLNDADMPEGVRVDARIQLPDTYMAGLERDSLKGCKVALTDRGQTAEDAFWVIGSPNYQANLPTRWSTTISLGRTDG